jgi:hypothetical protein
LTRIGFVVGLLALSPAPHAQQPPSAVTLPGLEQALDKITVVEPAPPAQVVQPPAPVVAPPANEQVGDKATGAQTPAPSPAPRVQQATLSIEQVADRITAAESADRAAARVSPLVEVIENRRQTTSLASRSTTNTSSASSSGGTARGSRRSASTRDPFSSRA